MEKKKPKQFLEKYSGNEYTENEHKQFIQWLKTASPDEVEAVLDEYKEFFAQLPTGETQQHDELIGKIELGLDAVDSLTIDEPKEVTIWPFVRKIASFAAILCVFIAVSLYFIKPSVPLNSKISKNNIKIVPGGNKAVLTLANGSQIVLDDVKNGVLASQGGIVIHKTNSGELVYDASRTGDDTTAGAPIGFNTISTPRGGQYQVVLPDGSKVWLNAASSLKYPTTFTGDERVVELSGEGYFEVAKNKLKPFKVNVNHTQVEVLGTHFNIMAYNDESSTNTTLLEGSVKITKGTESKIIIPGQQAKVSSKIKIVNVNTDEVIEWKNGNFSFSHENIQSIMRKISRWYDVDIEYQGPTTKEGFVGTVPRSEDISEVLKPLELSGLVHFKIQERRLIVMP